MSALFRSLFGFVLTWWGTFLIAALDASIVFFLPFGVDAIVIFGAGPVAQHAPPGCRLVRDRSYREAGGAGGLPRSPGASGRTTSLGKYACRMAAAVSPRRARRPAPITHIPTPWP